MMCVILNIFGLIIIVFSLFFIRKDIQSEIELYKEIELIYNDIKSYSSVINNTFDNFYKLVEVNLKDLENFKSNNIDIELDSEIDGKSAKTSGNVLINHNQQINELNKLPYDEIISLKELGLNNEEIAKHMNMGVREIEIIIKMWGNIKL